MIIRWVVVKTVVGLSFTLQLQLRRNKEIHINADQQTAVQIGDFRWFKTHQQNKQIFKSNNKIK